MLKTIDAIKVAITHGQLSRLDPTSISLVEGGSAVVDAIPAFAHPLEYTDLEKQTRLALDARSFGKFDSLQNIFRVRNDMEYKLAAHRAALNQIWITQSPTILRDISQLPMSIFSSWISEAVARRYALDPREQLNIAILSAIFYNSLFSDETSLVERDRLRIANTVMRALRVSAQDVFAILDQVSVITDLTSFCALAENISGTVRLKDLNVGILISILGGTWFGTNAKEMVAVALEHPPTWLALLLAALSERSFKNSSITKLAERASGKDGAGGYMRSVLNLITHAS